MSRRANLPGAAELFRVTDPRVDVPAPEAAPAGAGSGEEARAVQPVPLRPAEDGRAAAAGGRASPGARRQPSGRERHDEKITVYVSAEELHELEHARLVLRREHGVRADRGRLVREALAVVLGDLEAHGADSVLVRRLLHEG